MRYQLAAAQHSRVFRLYVSPFGRGRVEVAIRMPGGSAFVQRTSTVTDSVLSRPVSGVIIGLALPGIEPAGASGWRVRGAFGEQGNTTHIRGCLR